MRTTRYASHLLFLTLIASACSDTTAPDARGGRSSTDVDVSDPRGELIVSVRYGGQPHSATTPVADNDCQLLVNVGVPAWSGNAIGFCEGSRTTLSSPGTFSSNAWIYDGYTYPTITSNIPVVVTAGQTTNQVYELADYTGILSGKVTIDGTAAKSPYKVCLSTGGCSSFPKGDGIFALITKPGAGTGVIRNNTGNQLATFSYTALQGQTIMIADQATTDPRGTLTAEVRYGGAFWSPSSPIADNDCQVLVNVGVPSWSGNAIGFCEKTRTTVVVPGTYGSNIWLYDGYVYPTLSANIPVTVVNGETTVQVYDVAPITGIVSGRVMVDGVPAAAPISVCLSTGGCSYFNRGNGEFRILTKPGSGTGVVRTSVGAQLGTFTYSVAPGEAVAVPEVQATDPRGTLVVEVKYNGSFFSPTAPVADNDCQFLVNVGVPAWSGNAVGACERTRTASVTPGTFGSNIWVYDGYTYPTLTGNIPITVANGQTVTQVYDLAPITAIVSGRVMVNGQPAASPYRVCLSSGGCSYFPHADGRFRLLTKPGTCTGAVWNNIGVQLATFNCGTSAGETKDVGTIGDDATPPVIAPSVVGTMGAGGWYTSDVSVSWSVTDAQSAIAERTGCGPSSVSSDVAAATFTCSARSTGGTATQSVTVKRDATAPTVAFTGNAGAYTVDQQVSIGCTATDAMSGVASSTCAPVSGPAYGFTTGSNTIGATASDHAGNASSATATFSVQVTAGSLCELVKRFVDKPGVANSMCVKLSGTPALNAFANELRAQTGKSISASNAALLLRLAGEM
ncbi:MAG TPA: hypothetical protein VFO55_14145 [Gemmatimonadaceae bacterium]|nr:hypothetical protein [Gemmatimonadaceae bacterium]